MLQTGRWRYTASFSDFVLHSLYTLFNPRLNTELPGVGCLMQNILNRVYKLWYISRFFASSNRLFCIKPVCRTKSEKLAVWRHRPVWSNSTVYVFAHDHLHRCRRRSSRCPLIPPSLEHIAVDHGYPTQRDAFTRIVIFKVQSELVAWHSI